MPKQLIFGKESRQALFKGIEILAKAVTATLGPKGRNVTLGKTFVAPLIIHDGVTIAKEISLVDPYEDIGAQLVKEAALKTNDKAGDGTTTSTLLAYEIIKQGLEYLDKGVNPQTLKKGIANATNLVIEKLKEMARPVDSKEKIEQVATISSASFQIGKLIAEAFDKVGIDGVVTVEESGGMTTTVEFKEGMEIDKGYVTSHFVTDSEKMESEIVGPHILLTDQKITSAQEVMVFLEKCVAAKIKDVVVLADSVESEALATFLVNRGRDTVNSLCVFAPAIADRRTAILEDIAVLTGATVISRDFGKTFEKVEIADLGQADKVWADDSRCRIIGGKGDKKRVDARIKQIRAEIEKATNEFDKEKIKERLSKLTSGAAIIKAGAPTEIELKELKERIIDAVGATKAAIEEGIVAGGGVALLQARNAIDDKSKGAQIVFESLEMPIRIILQNAGVDDENEIITKAMLDNNSGYDVEAEKYVDMFEAGIVDPLKVVKSALINASSVAGQILTSEVVVADVKEKKTEEG